MAKTAQDTSKRGQGAIIHAVDSFWDFRVLFLESFSHPVAKPIREAVRTKVYPVYEAVRDRMSSNSPAEAEEFLTSTIETYADGTQQVIVIPAKGTASEEFELPVASYMHLTNASQMGFLGIEPEAFLTLKKAIDDWATEFHLSPKYWTTANAWLLSNFMMTLNVMYRHGGAGAPMEFGGIFTPTPPVAGARVPFNFHGELEWIMTEERTTEFEERLRMAIDKQVKERVKSALKQGVEHYKPLGFIVPNNPENLERDMQWLIARHCHRHGYEDIAGINTNASTVRRAVTARAKEMGLVLGNWKKREGKNP